MIRHTVVFRLKYDKNSPEEIVFQEEAKKLSSIPGVKTLNICAKRVKRTISIMAFRWNSIRWRLTKNIIDIPNTLLLSRIFG